MDPRQLYVLAIYWTIQTITTVGYGDLDITNTLEVVFCSIIMVVGVMSFSFANGSLTSILSSYDSQNNALQQKIEILNRIYQEFYLPLDLYMQCKKNLEFNTKSNHRQVIEFLDNLPHKLKMDVTHIIHEKRY